MVPILLQVPYYCNKVIIHAYLKHNIGVQMCHILKTIESLHNYVYFGFNMIFKALRNDTNILVHVTLKTERKRKFRIIRD